MSFRKFGFIAVTSLGLSRSVAFAEMQTTTIESRVVAVPSSPSSTTTTYKIFGPNQVEYVIEGTPDQVAELTSQLQKNPSTVVHCEGNVVDGPTKSFHVSKWQEVRTTQTVSSGPSETVKTTTTETTTR